MAKATNASYSMVIWIFPGNHLEVCSIFPQWPRRIPCPASPTSMSRSGGQSSGISWQYVPCSSLISDAANCIMPGSNKAMLPLLYLQHAGMIAVPDRSCQGVFHDLGPIDNQSWTLCSAIQVLTPVSPLHMTGSRLILGGLLFKARWATWPRNWGSPLSFAGELCTIPGWFPISDEVEWNG
jgi:hypothetical protein